MIFLPDDISLSFDVTPHGSFFAIVNGCHDTLNHRQDQKIR